VEEAGLGTGLVCRRLDGKKKKKNRKKRETFSF
jgi:hypothetical protein